MRKAKGRPAPSASERFDRLKMHEAKKEIPLTANIKRSMPKFIMKNANFVKAGSLPGDGSGTGVLLEDVQVGCQRSCGHIQVLRAGGQPFHQSGPQDLLLPGGRLSLSDLHVEIVLTRDHKRRHCA